MNPATELAPQLKQLRLSGILDSLDARNRQAIDAKLAYTEFLALLIQDEIARREQKKFGTRLRRAAFRATKTLEGFEFDRLPSTNRALVHDLATGRYIDERAPVLIVGPCGTGKSHLAQALGHCAVRQGHDVIFASCAQLLASLNAARAVGTYERKLQQLARVPVLIIDLCAAASDVESDGQSLTWRGLWPRRLHIASSQPSQPSDEVDVNARAGLGGRSQGFRKHLGKRLAFQVQVGTCVLHRRVQGGMPKPLADRREVNSGLEQVNRRGMSQRVGVYPLLLQGARRGCTGRDVLVEQIPDTEACEFAAALVRE